jgi:hypothetical protein
VWPSARAQRGSLTHSADAHSDARANDQPAPRPCQASRLAASRLTVSPLPETLSLSSFQLRQASEIHKGTSVYFGASTFGTVLLLGRREKLGMVLHPQPEEPMAFAGVERPVPLAGLPQTGSLQREWRRCGKQRCRCARGILHGPYWYLRWRERGRQRRQYVPRERRDAMHVALEERRRLRPPVWSLRQSLTELRRLPLPGAPPVLGRIRGHPEIPLQHTVPIPDHRELEKR